MWWIISFVALVFLILAAMAVTFIVVVALNGFPSLPTAFAIIYLVFVCLLLPALSLLAGYLAKRYTESNPNMPLWVAGILTTMGSLAILPIALCGLTYVLLLAFGLI